MKPVHAKTKFIAVDETFDWPTDIRAKCARMETRRSCQPVALLLQADIDSDAIRLLDREIFLAIWIVLFALLGVYLLGKLKFHHDDELPKNDFGQSC